MSKENSKRIREITAFAAALIMVGAFSLPSGTEIMGVSFGNAIVASAETFGDYEYDAINEYEVRITGYHGSGRYVVIPNDIDGKAVTSIGNNAFNSCTSLESITIPDGVTSIGNYAFDNCTYLTNINIPDSVTSIGNNAFNSCTSLAIITIPSGVTSIGKYAFYGCTGLTSIIIPDRVTSIGDNAFGNCSSLTSINIPDGVTSIGESTFQNCSHLISITIPGNVTSIGTYAFRNCTSLRSITIPDSVNSIGYGAFGSCTSLTSITIPDSVNSIENYAFSGCESLESIFIPDSVTSIGTDAIPDSATKVKYTVDGDNVTVTEVTLGGGQSSFTIPDTIDGKTVKAVYINDGTTGVNVPESATQIKYTVVANGNVTITGVTPSSGQTSVVIPEKIVGKTVTAIGVNTFNGCLSLESITIPNSVTSIGDNAFIGCKSLKSITLPSNSEFKCIPSFGFKDCSSLTSITIPDSVTSIGMQAFSGCTGLTSITIPDSVTSIGNDAFFGCTGLTSITIPDSVTSIREHAFDGCTGLTSITIPESVTSIGSNAFSGCESLESIFIPDSVTSIGIDAIPASATQIRYNADTEGNITIKKATLGSGQTSVVIPEKIGGKAVTAIGDYAFGGCSSLASITIPDSVVSIENDAFSNCTSLASVYFGDNSQLTSIGDSAFYSCSNLKSIKFPESVQSIGNRAFMSCASFESVTIPKNVSSIGQDAFISCSSINVDENNPNYSSNNGVLFSKNKTHLIRYPANKSGNSYVIPDSVKSIDEYAFAACRNLTSVTIPEGVTSIGDWAFSYCLSLKSITIPNSVNSIGNYAFYYESIYDIESIFLPNSLTSIGIDAISGVKTKVRYTVDDEGNATIVNIVLGVDQTNINIPEMIGEYSVIAVAEEYQQYVGEHTHLGGSATCTEKPVCSICGQGYDEALGHSFTKYVSDNNSTCTENGTETADCDRCNETDTRDIPNTALGHDHSGKWQNDTADHWKVCTRNDCEEILDKANHDFDDGVVTTEPTEDAEGVRTYTCETCGYKKTESIAKLNHTHKPSEEYSKDETGHWHDCSGCDEKIGFESHKFGEGVVTTEPTEETEGVKTFTCKDCGYTKTETIPVTEPSIPETPEEKVNSFVERLYENVLGRPSDPSKETHIDNLNEGKTATKVAYDFVFSPEFTELDISNEERVTIMYNTFLDRDPDPAGLETWTKALDNGCSIGHIFYGFTQSGEFGEICDAYGIEQGTWEYVENRDKSAELTSFVSRLYTKALNRTYDVNGLNDHTGAYLENHDLYQLAYDFIFSPEFLEKNLSDEDFVDTMYRTFFDREADPDGRADWLGRLKSGCSREEVLAGFVGSQECINLVARFGI